MKLKKPLSAFGVLTVAVAALATGPAAAFAANDTVGTDAAQPNAAGDFATGKLVIANSNGTFTGYTLSGTKLKLGTQTTLVAAEAVSPTLTVPKIGRSGPITTADGKCVVASPRRRNPEGATEALLPSDAPRAAGSLPPTAHRPRA